MILDSYRDHRGDPPGKFKYIGYWTSLRHVEHGYGELPKPQEFVAEMGPTLLLLLAFYLDVDRNRLATIKEHWRGWSLCRICGCDNGSLCITDGTFVWPEGLRPLPLGLPFPLGLKRQLEAFKFESGGKDYT